MVAYDEEIDYVVTTAAPIETPVGSTDYVWFEDATDGLVKKCLIDDMPGGGGGGGAPASATYLVKTTTSGDLPNERVVDDDQVEADWGTAGHVKFKLADITNDTLLGFDSGFGGGGVQEIPLAGGLEFTGGPGLRRAALTGDVTASAGSNTTAIGNNKVTNAMIRQGGTCSVIGTAGSGPANVADISAGSNNQILQRVSGSLTFTASPDNLTLSGTGNDLGGLSACKGRLIMLLGQFSSAGAQTIVSAHFGDEPMDPANLVFPTNLKVVGVGVNVLHSDASDPGAWTVHVKNETSGSSATKSCTMAGVSGADNITTGAMSSDLAFTAGDKLRLWMDGPTATGPQAKITIFLVTT